VGVGAPARVDSLGFEEGSHFAQRPGQVMIGTAVDADRSGVGSIQPHDHPHGRRFACPVGSEEAGDLTRFDVETEPVDGHLLPESLGHFRSPDGVRRSSERRGPRVGQFGRRHSERPRRPRPSTANRRSSASVDRGGSPGRPACPGMSNQHDDADNHHRHDDHKDEDPQAVMAVRASEEARAPERDNTAAHHERRVLLSRPATFWAVDETCVR
jgi:hypothetical protein